MLPSPHRSLRSILGDTNGIALIEFAYALPIVIALGFGGLETANLALAHLRVSQIGMTAADNAARVNTRIDETDVNEVFAGVEVVGLPIDFKENGRLILSSLQFNEQPDEDDQGQMINWQRCFGDRTDIAPAYGVEDDGRDDNSLQSMGDDNTISAMRGTAIMFVEVSYQYQPLIPGFLPDRLIRYESAFNVRERVEQDISNTTTINPTPNPCTVAAPT